MRRVAANDGKRKGRYKMTIVLLVLVAYGFYELIAFYSNRAARRRAVARVQAAEVRSTTDIRASVEQMIAAEREQIERREAETQAAEESERREESLLYNSEERAKINYKLSIAESDAEHWKEQTGNLYALLDIAQNELEQSIIGGKNQSKYQKQVITLKNQIHLAEQRLMKAEHEKEEAQRKLTEVA